MKKYSKAKNIAVISLIVLLITAGIFYYRTRIIVEISDEDIALAGGITPQMFGAKGNGITDDSKAVQAAIDYAARKASKNKASVVFIPEGTYSVKKIKLKQGVVLRGEEEKSVLLADPSSKVWHGILYCEDLDSVDISGITFDGNKPVVYGNHQEGTVNMWVVSSSNVNITNCIFQNNWYLGVCIKDSNNIVIENNKFINLDCGVITTDKPSSNILIKGNYFDGAEYSEPVSIYGQKEGYHNNITIIDNIMKNHTKGSGILVRAAKNVTIKNNFIDNCGTGIYITAKTYNGVEYGVYDAVIENNIITNTVYESILLSNINNSTISKNTIENAGTFGLLTAYVDESMLTENTFIDYYSSERPYHGFTMTITGMRNSSVLNNIIDIKDDSINKDRSPIVVGTISGYTNISYNNIFEGNVTTTEVLSLYKEDIEYSSNNVYAVN